MSSIRTKVKSIIYKLAIERQRKVVIRCSASNGVISNPLTDVELRELKKYWGGVLPVNQSNRRCFDLFKSYANWDARYISEDIFNAYVVRSLNMPANIIGYEHKGMYGMLFKGINQPETLIARINGAYYDCNYNLISCSESERLLHSVDEVFSKATVFSNQGKGVGFYKSSDLSIAQLEDRFGDDFIVQKPVKQSQITKRFSKNSLNTFRISTLLINGKCSLCTILFRCGVGESMVDNGYAGNVLVGVEEDGQFHSYGFDKWFNKHDCSDTGISFSNCKIEEVKELVRFAINNHSKYLPLCGFVGWDLAMDENDNPILIEVNLFEPGVFFEQLCVGKPLFGERTEETIAQVKAHRPNWNSITMSSY